MAAKAKKTKEVMIDSESWLEMLYQLFNENEIRKIAAVIQLQIQGFTSKNAVKAPPVILRKKTIEKLKQNIRILPWMKMWFETSASSVREAKIDFAEYCLNIAVRRSHCVND